MKPAPEGRAGQASGGASVADVFRTMAARARPEAVQGQRARLGYRITGEGGGEWTVVLSDGTVRVTAGLEQPGVVTTMTGRDFLDLHLGNLDGAAALASGKLKMEGDASLAINSVRCFRKYSPPGAQAADELIMIKRLIAIPQRFATGPLMGRFLKELRDHKRILGNRCPRCHRIQSPPREVCAVCRVAVDELVEIGPEGEVVSYDITYYASPDPLTGQSREAPYCAAFFVLDGCGRSDVFWHEVNPAHVDRIHKGSRVKPVWSETRTGSITDIKHFDIIE